MKFISFDVCSFCKKKLSKQISSNNFYNEYILKCEHCDAILLDINFTEEQHNLFVNDLLETDLPPLKVEYKEEQNSEKGKSHDSQTNSCESNSSDWRPFLQRLEHFGDF